MNGHEFKEKYNDLVEDAKKILNIQPLTTNEENMIKNFITVKRNYKA